MKTEKLELKVAVEEIGRVKAFLRSLVGHADMNDRLTARLFLVVEEAVANVINHSGASAMTLKAWHEDDRLMISVADDGIPFDPTHYPPPNLNVPGVERQEGGLGIHYIRTMANGVAYRRESGNNILTLSFRAPLSSPLEGEVQSAEKSLPPGGVGGGLCGTKII